MEKLLREGKAQKAREKCEASCCGCLFSLGTKPKKKCGCIGKPISEFEIIKRRVNKEELEAAMMLSKNEKVTDISQRTDIPTKRLYQWKDMIDEYKGDMNKKGALLAFFKEKEAETYMGATFTKVSKEVVENIGGQEEADIEDVTTESPSQQPSTAPLAIEMTAQINNQTQQPEVEKH